MVCKAQPATYTRPQKESDLELRDYLKIVRQRRWLIALSFAACAGLALLYSSNRPPVYESSAKVFIGPRTVEKTDLTEVLSELTFSREFIASYAELMRSRTIAERVVERLKLNLSPEQVAKRISTTLVQDTRIIQVKVSDGSPDQAALIANTVVEAFINDVQSEFGGRSSVAVTNYEPAIPPSSRSAPSPVRDGVLGGFMGLLIGVGGAVLLEQLNTRLRTRDDIERALAPLPILVAVPRLSLEESRRRRFAVDADPRGVAAEAFRILRTNVQFLAIDRPIRRIIITGALAGDGKTTVAANLAASLAAAGYRTLLMETDLRRPTVHEYIDERPSPGISDVLLGRATLKDATRTTTIANLEVLTSGALPPNPSELLGSQRMVDIVEQAAASHDMIVMDTPPTLPVTDSVVLAPRTDGVIIVVRAGQTHRDAARAMVEQFERVGARVLGVVFNAAAASAAGYGDYYYYEQVYGEGKRDNGFRSRRRAASGDEPARARSGDEPATASEDGPAVASPAPGAAPVTEWIAGEILPHRD